MLSFNDETAKVNNRNGHIFVENPAGGFYIHQVKRKADLITSSARGCNNLLLYERLTDSQPNDRDRIGDPRERSIHG